MVCSVWVQVWFVVCGYRYGLWCVCEGMVCSVCVYRYGLWCVCVQVCFLVYVYRYSL